MKMQNEGRKIMHLPNFPASVTCVRVPVYRAHSVAISAEFDRPVSRNRRAQFWQGRRASIWSTSRSPIVTPLRSRLLERTTARRGGCAKIVRFENGLALWVAGDQLLKGAALNAVQIAELL